MTTKEKLNVQIINATFVPTIKLWVRKDKNIVRDLFQIIHIYEHYYILRNPKGVKVCARFQEIKSNSEEDPMCFY